MRTAPWHWLLLGPLALALLLAAAPGSAATITIVNGDAAGEGFNDPTPRSPVPGNAGTTLGQQRLNAFAAAAAYWANRLVSPVHISIFAQMNPLTCSSNSGVLGSAGAISYFAEFPGATRPLTWFPAALANKLNGSDLDPGAPDIVAEFNTLLDTSPSCLTGFDWWYGTTGTPPANTFNFYQTILHEFAHGLGFLTIVDSSTGARPQGLDDIFMSFLEDHSTAKTWPAMTNGERAASARDNGDLHWTGTFVQTASSSLSAGRHPSGHVRMYAPSTFQPGSSVTHWDTVLVPDEIMEPNATATPADLITTQFLKDVGWTLQTSACVPDASTACLQSGRFEVKVDWQTTSTNGTGQVMSFGGQRAENSESVFWWFFSPTNFEMGVKVLNACVPPFSKYWVFISGLTDQGWTVNVRDTQTGIIRTYSNAVGHLSSTFADTNAFTCP